MQSKEEKAKPTTHEAKLSVMIFLSGVSVIVLLLLFKNQIGHTLSSRDLIVMIMMFCAWLMYLFCKVDLATIKDAPIFKPKSRSKPSRYSSENDVLIEKSVKYTDFFLLSIVYV